MHLYEYFEGRNGLYLGSYLFYHAICKLGVLHHLNDKTS